MKPGTRVRIVHDRRPYIRGRVGTVSVCPDGTDTGEGTTVVDLDTEYGGVDPDWHLDTVGLEPIEGDARD